MATPRCRSRHSSLGHLHLSSGEIELYSRQDEIARRRHRLLSIRDQERRLAQQVTQRYRENLHKLQCSKRKRTQQQLNVERQALLTELDTKYKNSLQNVGTAQRYARLKLVELLEQAQNEEDKWAYNRQVAEKWRVMQAKEAQSHEEEGKMARRQQIQQKVERWRLASSKQRQQANARAQRDRHVAAQRAEDLKQIETLNKMQRSKDVILMPKLREKDVLSYQYSRIHCLAPTLNVKRPEPAVICHNLSHPTAIREKEEAKKFLDALDLKREQDRLIKKNQLDKAVERGKQASEKIVSKQQGKQAVEWLAMVDQMERRARGRTLGENVDNFHVRELGERDNPENMTEQKFAQLFELNGDSIELSEFSIETDDDQLVCGSRKGLNGDKVAAVGIDANITLKVPIVSDVDSVRDQVDAAKDDLHASDGQFDVSIESSSPAKSTENLKHEQLNDLKSANDTRERVGLGDYLSTSVKSQSEFYDSNGILGADDDDENVSNKSQARKQVKKVVDNMKANTAVGSLDTEVDQVDFVVRDVESEKSLVEQEGQYLQDGLHLRSSKPRIHRTERIPVISNAKLDQFVNLFEKVAAEICQSDQMSDRLSSASDGDREGSVKAVLISSKDSNKSLLSKSSIDAANHSTSSVNKAASVQNSDDNYHNSQHCAKEERENSFLDAVRICKGEESVHGDQDVDSSNNAIQAKYANDIDLKYSSSYRSDKHEELSESAESVYKKHEKLHSASINSIQSKEKPTIISTHINNDKLSSISRNSYAGNKSRNFAEHNNSDIPQSTDDTKSRHEQAVTSGAEEKSDNAQIIDGHNSPEMAMNEDEDSASDMSFNLSQKSLSRLDQVVNDKSKSLRQRYINQHIMSCSSSNSQTDEEREIVDNEDLSSSFGSNHVHSTVNYSSDPYRQQIKHYARRSSTSAVSIAQYSLPPSDSQSSFDDSFHRVHSESGDDSFVNELVPIFPTRTPSRTLHANQTAEAYDDQLVPQNMSNIQTKAQQTLERSRQYVNQNEPTTDRLAASATVRRVLKNDDAEHLEKRLSSFKGQNLSRSSDSDSDVSSVGPVYNNAQSRRQSTAKLNGHGRTIKCQDDGDGEQSSASGVSSLGFSVQLHLAAGISRSRQKGVKQDVSERQDNQYSDRMSANDSNAKVDNGFAQSFASDSSASMGSPLTNVTNMTSLVDKVLPLHLRVPAMIYGTKSMTKPPPPMLWSESSVSSSSNASESSDRVLHSTSEKMFLSSKASPSDSQCVSSSSPIHDARSSSNDEEKMSDESSLSSFDHHKNQVMLSTHISSRNTVLQLPPPPVGPVDMSQRPLSMQHSSKSQVSLVQQSNVWSADTHQLLPPSRPCNDMTQPPTPFQNFHIDSQSYISDDERKLDDSSNESNTSAKFSAERNNFSITSRSSRHVKKAERFVVPTNNSNVETKDENGKELSLAEAFKRRHPRFSHQVKRHRDEMKGHTKKLQDQVQTSKQPVVANHDTSDELPVEKRELLTRLTSGTRAKISSREMKDRSRRLYHQLPEVVERKRQEEVMRRRRERLDELREQEKERRFQHKQRRQQQLK
ncbi:hypothetical protein Plhal304r1_c062g0149791 [Plasmopara halstedii]